MNRTIRFQSVLPAAIVATLTLAVSGESLAQDTAQRAGSLALAIDEARRSPFHAGLQPTLPAAVRDEFGQMPRALESQTLSPGRAELVPKVFFHTLPVIFALDATFIYPMTRNDGEGERGRGDFRAWYALGAIVGPAFVARLSGARLPVAMVGSTLGFSGVAMATLMLGKAAYFLGPLVHAGATAFLVAASTR